MAINSDKPDRWAEDIKASVALYNEWYETYAPQVYRDVRDKVRDDVLNALTLTGNLRQLDARSLRRNPGVLPVLRMCTSPPLAVDRMVGLAGVSKNLVAAMESGVVPQRMGARDLEAGLGAIAEVLDRMIDRDLFPWIAGNAEPTESERMRAAGIVADRLALSIANPIVRNAQEQRQLDIIAAQLQPLGYTERRHPPGQRIQAMEPGTYAYRMNVPSGAEGEVNIPVDVVIQPHRPRTSGLPLLIEAKSAGDFTNVNKRRKEEADKVRHLRERYGDTVEYVLFLGGYFDRGYLEYEARAGIDWIWEHRPEEIVQLGLQRG